MAITSQAVAIFAGEPMVSSKQVVAPPPPAPVSYFRGNEFDIGAFATYVTGTNGGGTVTSRRFVDDETVTLSSSGSPHGWGGGMDFTYFLPWKYAGFRFQGSGLDLSTQTGIFGEADYNWVSGGNHNFNSGVKDFVQVNFGLRYAS
jgi:hypothetical protein